jgi:hypothetical protein
MEIEQYYSVEPRWLACVVFPNHPHPVLYCCAVHTALLSILPFGTFYLLRVVIHTSTNTLNYTLARLLTLSVFPGLEMGKRLAYSHPS